MKRFIFTLLALISFTYIATAQNSGDTGNSSGYRMPASKYWKFYGNTGINLSQTSYTHWSAGGDSSFALDFFYNYSADYKRGKRLWINRLELAYGFSDTKSTGKRKTNDKIYFSSSYGYEIAKNLYAAGLLTFNTQFAKGYDYAESTTDYISKFMAPGYLSAGAGIIWIPKTWLKVTFSPATYRATFVTDSKLSDAGSFGVDPGKKILHQFGANLRGEVNYEIMKNIMLYSRLDLFSNYLENPQNIVVNWDIQLSMKVNKWISANFTVNMLYDDNIRVNGKGPRLQVKEMLGIGLQVNF